MIQVLRYTEELEKVGFFTEQAKKSVQIWMDLMDQNFATKADFKEHYFMTKADSLKFKNEMNEFRNEIKNDFANLKTELKNDFKDIRLEMKDMEYRLTVKLGIMFASSIAILSAIMSFKA